MAVGEWNSVQVDRADPVALASFWATVLGSEIHDRLGDPPHYVSVEPSAPGGPWISFQRVAEPKIVKNRLHLNLTVDNLDQACERIEALGGRRVPGSDLAEYGFRWRVMVDPEGNEFCLVLDRRDLRTEDVSTLLPEPDPGAPLGPAPVVRGAAGMCSPVGSPAHVGDLYSRRRRDSNTRGVD
jgi:predicted enzyme related to lactoylglutathione lyase